MTNTCVCGYVYTYIFGFPGDISGKNTQLPFQETQEIRVGSLGWEDLLEKDMANPLQYSCLENPMDRGAWWATVHRVTQRQTQLKWLSTHAEISKVSKKGISSAKGPHYNPFFR